MKRLRKDKDEVCPKHFDLNGMWLEAPDTGSSNIPLNDTYNTE